MSDQDKTVSIPASELSAMAKETQDRILGEANALFNNIMRLTDASPKTATLKQEATAAFQKINSGDMKQFREFLNTFGPRHQEAMTMTGPVDIRALLGQMGKKE